MMKRLLALFVSLYSTTLAISKILPTENGKLSYRVVGFSVPPVAKCTSYQLEIADGLYDTEDSFKAHVIKTVNTGTPNVVAEVPSFGKQYTWRVLPATGHSGSGVSAVLHHFSTLTTSLTDTLKFRFHVLKKAEKYKDAYVFLDGNKGLYDMDGNLVWFFPPLKDSTVRHGDISDIKVTPSGTITFLWNDMKAFEINYAGDILWQGPNNNIASQDIHYHHELTKLSNGHYMVLRTEVVYWAPNAMTETDSALYRLSYKAEDVMNESGAYLKFPFSVLTEYDKNGKTIWEWKFLDYFKTSDLNRARPAKMKESFDAHPNSFCFDEKEKKIYISLRNVSRLLKVDYPSGKLLATYGEVFKPGVRDTGNMLFSGQHSVKLTSSGYLYLYNNNVGDKGLLPNVLTLKEDPDQKIGLQKINEIKCEIDDMNTSKRTVVGFSRGGNAMELPDGSFFVSMSSPYCKVFISAPDRKVLWSAYCEYWNRIQKKWDIVQQYRAFLVKDRTELEKMIWSSETEK